MQNIARFSPFSKAKAVDKKMPQNMQKITHMIIRRRRPVLRCAVLLLSLRSMRTPLITTIFLLTALCVLVLSPDAEAAELRYLDAAGSIFTSSDARSDQEEPASHHLSPEKLQVSFVSPQGHQRTFLPLPTAQTPEPFHDVSAYLREYRKDRLSCHFFSFTRHSGLAPPSHQPSRG